MRSSVIEVFAISLSLCSGLTVTAATREACAQDASEGAAQIRFQRGRELFVARDYAGALPEFRAAVAVVSSPNTRLYIARCLHELGRNAEALTEYRRAAAEAADRAAGERRYAITRDTARAEGARVEPMVGQLIVHAAGVPPGATITVAGNAVPTALYDVPAPMDPGAIEVSGSAPGYLPFHTTTAVAAGTSVEVTVALRRGPSTVRHAPAPIVVSRPVVVVSRGVDPRVVGISLAAVGLVGGAVGFGVLGSMASARYNELRAQCPNGCPEMESRIAEGERDQLFANVALGAGVGLMVVGGITAIVGAVRTQGTAPREQARGWSVWGAPTATGGISGVSIAF